jgi:adenylate cyclase
MIGFASMRLHRLGKRLRRLATTTDIDDPESLHALRIGVKRLRYALEFLSPLTPKRSLARASKRLAEVQETLGQLNDLTNAGSMLMECAGDDPRLREAVTLIGGWHGPRYANLLNAIATDIVLLTSMRLPKIGKGIAGRRADGPTRTSR